MNFLNPSKSQTRQVSKVLRNDAWYFITIVDHQILVEKPDAVKSVREQDIVEDDHHNVETTKSSNDARDDDEEEFDEEDSDYSS